MSRNRINIERVTVSMHGVSASIAEQATHDFEAELRRQLGAIRLLLQGNDLDMKSLDLGSVNLEATTDGETLRGLIAERLSAALLRELRAGENSEASWP